MKRLLAMLGIGMLWSFVYAEQIELLQPFYIPKTEKRLQVKSIENQSSSTFKFFYGAGQHRALILPHSQLVVSPDLFINQRDAMHLVPVNGDIETIYIQDGDQASGQVPSGYTGPYYISMWLGYPHIADASKLFVPYAIKAGQTGSVGIRIDEYGDCQILAHDNIQLL